MGLNLLVADEEDGARGRKKQRFQRQVRLYQAMKHWRQDEVSKNLWEQQVALLQDGNKEAQKLDSQVKQFLEESGVKAGANGFNRRSLANAFSRRYGLAVIFWELDPGCHNTTKNKLRLVESVPKGISESSRCVHIMLDNCRRHSILIYKESSLFLYAEGAFCFNCDSYFSRRTNFHSCGELRGQYCRACQRPVFNSDGGLNPWRATFQDRFCTEELDGRVCGKCNLKVRNSKCQERHEKVVCSNKWSCPECPRTIVRRSGEPPLKDLIASHLCFTSDKCQFCYERHGGMPQSHVCRIQILSLPRFWPKVSVMHPLIYSPSSDGCEKCFVMRQTRNGDTFSTLCDDHAVEEISGVSDDQDFVLAVGLAEEQDNGIWTTTIFSDGRLNVAGETKESSLKLCQPSGQPEKPESEQTKKSLAKTLAALVRKVEDHKRFRPKDNLMHRLIAHILSRGGRRTYLSHGQSEEILPPLFAAFCELDVTVNASHKDSKLTVIELPAVGIKFIYFCAFVAGTDISQMLAAFSVRPPHPFFPSSFISPGNFSYRGPVPAAENYYSLFDSPETREAKSNFVLQQQEQLGRNWSFRKAASLFLESQSLAIAEAAVRFIDECISLQVICGKIYRF